MDTYIYTHIHTFIHDRVCVDWSGVLSKMGTEIWCLKNMELQDGMVHCEKTRAWIVWIPEGPIASVGEKSLRFKN